MDEKSTVRSALPEHVVAALARKERFLVVVPSFSVLPSEESPNDPLRLEQLALRVIDRREGGNARRHTSVYTVSDVLPGSGDLASCTTEYPWGALTLTSEVGALRAFFNVAETCGGVVVWGSRGFALLMILAAACGVRRPINFQSIVDLGEMTRDVCSTHPLVPLSDAVKVLRLSVDAGGPYYADRPRLHPRGDGSHGRMVAEAIEAVYLKWTTVAPAL